MTTRTDSPDITVWLETDDCHTLIRCEESSIEIVSGIDRCSCTKADDVPHVVRFDFHDRRGKFGTRRTSLAVYRDDSHRHVRMRQHRKNTRRERLFDKITNVFSTEPLLFWHDAECSGVGFSLVHDAHRVGVVFSKPGPRDVPHLRPAIDQVERESAFARRPRRPYLRRVEKKSLLRLTPFAFALERLPAFGRVDFADAVLGCTHDDGIRVVLDT